MGIRGVIREIERASNRIQKEREKQYKLEQKTELIESCRQEVSDYENYLKSLKSYHLEDCDVYDWEKKSSQRQPREPSKKRSHEALALKAQQSYVPSVLDKLFSRIEKKRKKLTEDVISAKKRDDLDYNRAKDSFATQYTDWERINRISRGVLNGNLKSYQDAIEEIELFDELDLSCNGIHIVMNTIKVAIISIQIPNEEDVVPTETKSFLKSGKVSIKSMPITKHNELFQDYVCSLSIAAAKILLAALPLEIAIVNASKSILNPQTGHVTPRPILSVAISGSTLSQINLRNIDPSDCMRNFRHNMTFKKNAGFGPTDVLDETTFG